MKSIISLTWLLGLTVLVQGQNLLTNGNFETGLVKGHFANGYPDGWDGCGTNGWHHADQGYRRDNYGIAIWDNDTSLTQTFSVLPGMQMRVSGQMIYHDVEILTNKKAILKIEFWNGTNLQSWSSVGDVAPHKPAGIFTIVDLPPTLLGRGTSAAVQRNLTARSI